MGFAGTVAKKIVTQPYGLATLTNGELGNAPQLPMLPVTWAPQGIRAAG